MSVKELKRLSSYRVNKSKSLFAISIKRMRMISTEERKPHAH